LEEPALVDARGLAALAGLLLWPGLLVVRAPWPAVPFLSVSFWLLTWWWLPSGAGRSALLGAALLFFVLLSAVRLMKPLAVSLPSRGTILVLVLSAVCLVPFFGYEVAPGTSLASVETMLAVWRDGFPSTYEPLVPIPSFGAHAPGLPFLAADVSLVSGLAPHRAVALVSLASAGLLGIAVAFLAQRMASSALGIVGAIVVAATTLVLSARGAAVPGPAVLALAMGLACVALLVRGTGRSPAVAAGTFLAAAFTVEAAAPAVCALAILAVARSPERSRPHVALTLALALAAPRLFTAVRAWSLTEARSALHIVGRGGSTPRPDRNGLEAMAWVRYETAALDCICVKAGGPGWFLPSIAHRAVVPAEVPLVYRDEVVAGPGKRARTTCRYALIFGPADPRTGRFVPSSAPSDPRPREAFAVGSVRVFELASADGCVTSFDTLVGNQPPPRP
jgi:hypothetical protein